MKIRMHSMLRSLALVLAAAALTAGLSTAPTARADDLNFTGTTLSGAGFNGASLQGKPAVLWFWTPWCPFCNQEAPNVSAVAAANPKVTFVGVAARSDVAQMQSFVSKYNLNFTNLNDADGSIWAKFNVPWQPAYVFLRPDGTSTFVNNPTSAMSQQELSDRVRALTS
ncbi:MAG TPA: protein disulfide oxidoreductase [Mycobacterium sp.]|jgi:thiol-disulfide isomerase/thioredoxin|nr:protein disulfide oxidoreductase [Mycobacterium sp.]TXI40186.1 MAG: protein disulfide oxidoreductase [Mycobacterium sp.]HNA51610.1 protein disulfide oxidoreductase [Mycobacterium sp.]HNF04721.1 protein disulfide oxidoreductase [Mycobacterium sp.]HNM10671.1 protein disulfide oxidoreductase [Mycobacterium sp.]